MAYETIPRDKIPDPVDPNLSKDDFIQPHEGAPRGEYPVKVPDNPPPGNNDDANSARGAHDYDYFPEEK